MNSDYYSERTITNFFNTKYFHKDDTLKRYYEKGEIMKFRRRLDRVYGGVDDAVIYTILTESLRDIIYEIIGKLTVFLKPYGDLVVSGGDAFNIYFPRDDRIITSDIDTKFVPSFSGDKSKYFGYLQCVKLLLWNHLGYLCKLYDNKVKMRLDALKNTKIFRFLGIRLSTDGPYLTRRYTLIAKKKQKDSNTAQPGDVLIDVELFAIDLKLTNRVIGGVLDIAVMRPNEFGYDVAFTRERGIYVTNPITKTSVYNPDIMVASKKFLVEDLYLMQSLGLRPTKKEKDAKRMRVFAKKVLGIDATSPTKIIQNVNITTVPLKRKPVPRDYVKLALAVDPYKYEDRTSVPKIERLKKQFSVPESGTQYRNTSSMFRFDINNKRWVINNNPFYVRDKYSHRPIDGNTLNTLPRSYNELRDNWLPRKIIENSALIPYVGLKNKNTFM